LLTISDTTPTEGDVLTIVDPDGTTKSIFSIQWQSSLDGTEWADIPDAIGESFSPGDLQVGRMLRVVVTYIIDDQGTRETVTSAATSVVGDVFVGGAGDDIFTGTEGDDIASGGAGDDTLNGLGGNDILNGNDGADTILGGAGNDTLSGGSDNDTLSGGLGNDTLDGGGGADTASYAGETDDMFIDLAAGTARRGSAEDPVEDTLILIDNVLGGAGNDTIAGDADANSLDGGAGNDTLNGAGNADTLNGGEGDDTLNGGDGNDTVNGGEGDDTINYTFGDGADTVDGGAGFDTLNILGTAAADTLRVIFDGTALTTVENGTVTGVESVTADLLAGVDTLNYAGTTAAVTVDLSTGAASGFTSIAGIEIVSGGDGDDSLSGGAGNDTLNGRAGNDQLSGGLGDDTLAGGSGTDTADYSAAPAAVTVDLGNTAAQDTGGAGIDTLLSVENVTGSAFGDTLTGTGGVNVLDGGAGNDTLNGRGGADILIGGAGNDVMNGGNGNDTFRFAAGFGNDTISGFDANPNDGQDLLNVADLGINADNFAARVVITDLGDNTRVTIGTDTMTFLGVNGVAANVITIDDFLFI
jgi:Ca2+-binding RTX toxin-like protein